MAEYSLGGMSGNNTLKLNSTSLACRAYRECLCNARMDAAIRPSECSNQRQAQTLTLMQR